MPSTNYQLSDTEQTQLLEIARQVIREGCQQQPAWQPKPKDYSHTLQQPAACFVTLKKHGQLRGCIGSLTARQALCQEVANDAWSAAFRDSRFEPVTRDELEQIQIELSILSPMQPLNFQDPAGLLAGLRPHVDGLLIEAGQQHATFLPQVWEQLPDPEQFLNQLLKKAGLDPQHWPADITASRYQVVHFSESEQL